MLLGLPAFTLVHLYAAVFHSKRTNIIPHLQGRKPTSSSSEAPVSMAEGTMPWQTESAKGKDADEHFKYQYHPGGDASKAPKDAPSALHSVIVPNVNLPKVRPQNHSILK